jgi:hypothetical protein
MAEVRKFVERTRRSVNAVAQKQVLICLSASCLI